MPETFFVVISLIAAVYAFFTKQVKIGLGFLVLAITFVLMIPNLTFGIKTDFLNAIALILFIVAAFIIVWKRPAKAVSEDIKPDEVEEAKKTE